MTVSAMAAPIDPAEPPCTCPGAAREPVWHAPTSLMQAGLECAVCRRRWLYVPHPFPAPDPQPAAHTSGYLVRLGAFAPVLALHDIAKGRA